jgi:mono/diheme cytochrome c family protein
VNAPLLGAMLAALAASAGAQQPPPFAHGDAKAGKALAEKDCVACHAQKGKPASAIYTRSDRRVTSAPKLLTQVQVCNAQLGSGYFPEDEENVAAYLNETYYKFKP